MGGLSYVQADMGFKFKLIKGFLVKLIKVLYSNWWEGSKLSADVTQFIGNLWWNKHLQRQLDNVASKYTQLHDLGV